MIEMATVIELSSLLPEPQNCPGQSAHGLDCPVKDPFTVSNSQRDMGNFQNNDGGDTLDLRTLQHIYNACCSGGV